ncbi:MAG: DUF6102 family protein [Clostridia bacterium]|nr:DUF6102 family protein [Clostridia bacterium]
MDKLLTNFIVSIISSADNGINYVFNNLLDVCFNAEENLTNIAGTQILNFDGLKAIILSFSISLIILKFLKKGFDVYILWVEGDTDTPPLTFITYFVRSLVIAISFPVLYEWMITVAKDFTNKILTTLNVSDQVGLTTNLAQVSVVSIFSAIFGIIVLIMLFLLYIQFIMRGIEMFILKLGFPLACVGLVDSDKGVFAPYVKKFFQSIVTVIVQIALAKIVILLIVSDQLINATAVLLVTLRTPKFLSEFMLISGNGSSGISNMIHTTSKSIELKKQLAKVVEKKVA